MSIWLLVGTLLFSAPHTSPSVNITPATQRLIAVMACRGENAPLERLACYDEALSSEQTIAINPLKAGPAWQKAMDHERKRPDHSTTFLVSSGSGDNPAVFVTTPAIGVPPPRPVLMFSCIDNITRLQVALDEPLDSGTVSISAGSDRFEARWFLRENGYLLESSRGLTGIDEIKRLLPANTLTIGGAGSRFPLLTFNISSLSQVLKPLRSACHW